MLEPQSYVLYEGGMTDTPTSISDLISKWPTIGEFAASIGCGYEAARQMKLRERIAPDHWSNVVSASKRKGIAGVSIEWLAAQRASSSKLEKAS